MLWVHVVSTMRVEVLSMPLSEVSLGRTAHPDNTRAASEPKQAMVVFVWPQLAEAPRQGRRSRVFAVVDHNHDTRQTHGIHAPYPRSHRRVSHAPCISSPKLPASVCAFPALEHASYMSFSSTPLGQGRRLDHHTFLNKNNPNAAQRRAIPTSYSYGCVASRRPSYMCAADSGLGHLPSVRVRPPSPRKPPFPRRTTQRSPPSSASPVSSSANRLPRRSHLALRVLVLLTLHLTLRSGVSGTRLLTSSAQSHRPRHPTPLTSPPRTLATPAGAVRATLPRTIQP